MARTFRQIFADVDGIQSGNLNAFRQRYTPSLYNVDGMVYRVCSVGEKDQPTIVFLPGGMGEGEVFFEYMIDLRRHFRTIYISYPPEEDIGDLCEALREILRLEGVSQPIICGYSVGGLFAQAYAMHAPEDIAGLILMNTGTCSDKTRLEVKRKWMMRRLRSTPMRFRVYSPQARRRLALGVFNMLCPDKYYNKCAFWRYYFEEIFENRIAKKQYIAINTGLVPDFFEDVVVSPPAGVRWKSNCLIFFSPEDAVFTPEETGDLRDIFPRAKAINTGDMGSFGMHIDKQLFLSGIEEFALSVFEKMPGQPKKDKKGK